MELIVVNCFFISVIIVLFIFVVVVVVVTVLVFTVIVVDVVIVIAVFVIIIIIIIIAVDVIIGLGWFSDRICRSRNIMGNGFFLNQFLTVLLSAVYQLVDLLIQNSHFPIKKLSFLIQFYNLCFQN